VPGSERLIVHVDGCWGFREAVVAALFMAVAVASWREARLLLQEAAGYWCCELARLL
jgi:hypothetical protein